MDKKLFIAVKEYLARRPLSDTHIAALVTHLSGALTLALSRFRAAPCARLSHLSFEGDRAFPAQC